MFVLVLVWGFLGFFLVVCFGFICLVGFGFFFSTGFPQLCLTLTSASGNQGSFHSPSASKSTLIFFFSPRVQLWFIQPEKAEVAMCKPCATHSDRQILCNPAKDGLSCWIMDLKSWSEIWIGRSNVILAEDSPLPLPCFVASQFAWTHPCPQESPACSRGQRKINRQFGYSSSDAEHVAGRNMIAIRWIPPGDRKSTDKVVWFVLRVFGFFFNKLFFAWISEVTLPSLSLGIYTDLR